MTVKTPSATTERSVLPERFKRIAILGSGSHGRMYLAEDAETGEKVAVKQLALANAEDWKAVELFERESDVLASLDHPRIPDYVGASTLESDGETHLFLAQEYVDGDSLRDRLEEGERWSEDEIRDFLEQMLDVLAYLGELNPPVVHRDIKPSNILRRDDGSYVLVDFGAVQAIIPEKTGGSTVGDLYALGVTAVYLMSGVHPSEIDRDGARMRFRDVVEASEELLHVLDGLLAPETDNRFSDADAAREALNSERTSRLPQETTGRAPAPAGPPPSTDLKLARSREELVVLIPGSILTKVLAYVLSAATVYIILPTTSFPFPDVAAIPISLALFVHYAPLRGKRLRITSDGTYVIQQRLFGIPVPLWLTAHDTDDLVDITADTEGLKLVEEDRVTTLEGIDESTDQEWIEGEIRDFLGMEER